MSDGVTARSVDDLREPSEPEGSDSVGRARTRRRAAGALRAVQVGPAGVDWAAADHDLPVDVLGARICALATRMAQATFHWLQLIAEFDRREGWAGVGIRSCAHWIAWTCSMATGTAREHVRVAHALQDLPLVSAEMAAGRLSYAKIREITRVVDRVDEATLVELARTATASQLARTVRGFRQSDGARAGQEQRRRAMWRVDDDGSVVLSARLPAEEGAAVIAALEAARDDLIRLSGRDPGSRAGDCSTSDQDTRDQSNDGGDDPTGNRPGAEHATRYGDHNGTVVETHESAPEPAPAPVDPADMLLQWARGYLSAAPQDRSGEDRTTVVIHVNAEHLLSEPNSQPSTNNPSTKRSRGNADSGATRNAPAPAHRSASVTLDRSAIPADCCQVAGVAGIATQTAARLACNAGILGIIRGEGGVVLAHGRRRRTVSAAQRRLLAIRDGGCQFPSCTRISHLEAHHVRHWMHGGRTDPDNLILLCRFHHMACHEGGVVIGYATDSVAGAPHWHFTTREGDPLRGDRLPSGAPGWKHDEWILWHGLDGSAGWHDPEAVAIRPLWAGEKFSLADAVGVLFQPSPGGGADHDTGRAAA